MRIILIALAIITLQSCADSKTFTTKDGKTIHAEPYGWANSDARKNEKVVYEVSVGNVVWSVIAVETVAVPVVLSGWQLFEPVRLKEE